MKYDNLDKIKNIAYNIKELEKEVEYLSDILVRDIHICNLKTIKEKKEKKKFFPVTQPCHIDNLYLSKDDMMCLIHNRKEKIEELKKELEEL